MPLTEVVFYCEDGKAPVREWLRTLPAKAVVISHGLIKEAAVPTKEIDRAISRREKFVANPAGHTMQTGG